MEIREGIINEGWLEGMDVGCMEGACVGSLERVGKRLVLGNVDGC